MARSCKTFLGSGLFYRDTCYLSSYALRLHGTVPLLLMSSDGEGMAAQMNLTNSHLATANGQVIADHKLSLRRTFLVLDDGPVFIDTISVRNFSAEHVLLPLSLAFSTTFESMFVLRGAPVGKAGSVARSGMGWVRASVRVSGSGRNPPHAVSGVLADAGCRADHDGTEHRAFPTEPGPHGD